MALRTSAVSCVAGARTGGARARSSCRTSALPPRRPGSARARRSLPGRATRKSCARLLHTSAAPSKNLPMEDAPAPAEPRKARRSWLLIALWIVLTIALATGFWLDLRARIGATQEEVARRLRDVETENRNARVAAREAQETAREMRTKLSALEQRVTESQSQQLAMAALYQELSRNRDEWQLAEIEQVLAIAQQQLQLSGNVRAALLALQLAEGRLARADRPQFLPVRRALARAIERLRAVPGLDLSGISLKLDSLVAAVDSLPLAFDERTPKLADERAPLPPAEKEARTGAEDGFFSRFGAEVWREIRQLIVVRKVETPEPPLLPPAQAYFVRENLKL